MDAKSTLSREDAQKVALQLDQEAFFNKMASLGRVPRTQKEAEDMYAAGWEVDALVDSEPAEKVAAADNLYAEFRSGIRNTDHPRAKQAFAAAEEQARWQLAQAYLANEKVAAAAEAIVVAELEAAQAAA